MSAPHFIEHACEVGGCACGAWAEWFVACDEADWTAVGQERDPAYLREFPFDPSECAKPETCRLYAAATQETPVP